jgi:hypothetical protein
LLGSICTSTNIPYGFSLRAFELATKPNRSFALAFCFNHSFALKISLVITIGYFWFKPKNSLIAAFLSRSSTTLTKLSEDTTMEIARVYVKIS